MAMKVNIDTMLIFDKNLQSKVVASKMQDEAQRMQNLLKDDAETD